MERNARPGAGGTARRVAVTIVGVLLCAAGVLLLVLPGPGLLLVLAGLVVLANEYPWAHRRIEPVRRRAMQAARESVASRLRIAGSVLAGLVLLGLGVAWIVVPALPFGRVATGSSLILSGLALLALLGYSIHRFRRPDLAAPSRRPATTERGMTRETRPGGPARTPGQIPPRGWWQVIRRAIRESSSDHVQMMAGGVAFFAFLAIFPALIAALTLYGMVADPNQVAQQVQRLSGALPPASRQVISEQLTAVAQSSDRALTVGLAVSLLAALVIASSGTSNLVKAINLAYDVAEARGFLKLRAVAFGLTLGAIVFVLVTLALVAVVPPALNRLGLGLFGWVVAQAVRWLLLVGMVAVGLAVVYHVAPNREAPRFRWVAPGVVVAAALWVVGTAGFSLYVSYLGNYNETYGALAGVVVLMLGLFLTSYVVLLGAEINAESERQTVRDVEPAQAKGD